MTKFKAISIENLNRLHNEYQVLTLTKQRAFPTFDDDPLFFLRRLECLITAKNSENNFQMRRIKCIFVA